MNAMWKFLGSCERLDFAIVEFDWMSMVSRA